MSRQNCEFKTVNFRTSEEDRRILLDLMEKTDRSAAYIIRKALRKITLEDLIYPLTEGKPHDDDHHNGQN